MTRRSATVVVLTAYIATIVAANWAITEYGIVPIGFGLAAPAGVFFAGLAFTFRDLTQEWGGLRLAGLAVLTGAAISYAIGAERVAVASALAFAASELVDLAVFTTLRRRGFLTAVLASNTVGLLVDSVVFLHLAFGSQEHLTGQIVGKAYMTAIAAVVLYAARHWHRRNGQRATRQGQGRAVHG